MEFKRQINGGDDDEAVSYNPPPLRESACSKPLLPSSSSLLREPPPASYRECLRNHAASLGSHVLDGCGEFMPDAADPMKCAACGCHRSFHRREGEISHLFHCNGEGRTPLLLQPPSAVGEKKLVQSLESSSEELGVAQAGLGIGHRPFVEMKKRFRTKFTGGQKMKMMEFAERTGWKIQKQDEVELERFCAEIGVSRQVFKVWMHNSKHSIRKQQQQQQQVDQNL